VSDEPVWIEREALLLAHVQSLRLFGGAEGLRDRGAPESALMRPVNAWSCRGETDLAALAAAYAFGLAKNHPFIDGNKRAAFLACVGFLKLNGFDLRAPQPEAYRTMMELAASTMTEVAYAAWLAAHMRPRGGR
jgi:death on curing protein